MTCKLLFVALFIPAIAFAQSEFHHNNVEVGIGAATPVGSDTGYLSTAPLISLSYGYRFNRLFQADAGLQIAFGAVNNQNAEVTDLGTMQGGDHEYMIPLGGRVYIPQPFKRIEVSAGGGAVYLLLLRNRFLRRCVLHAGLLYLHIAWRMGRLWDGKHSRYFLDSNRTFHVGTTVQFISGATNGQAVGSVPGNRTTDHWLNVFVGFGMSF